MIKKIIMARSCILVNEMLYNVPAITNTKKIFKFKNFLIVMVDINFKALIK